MSYNTRRTGAGRGQTTQVNYHQQQSRPGGQQPAARNPGYTTTQAANYNSSSQPVYSTQQPTSYTAPPAPPQQTQAPATPPAQPPLPTQQPPSTPVANLKQEPVTPANTPMATDTPASENGDGTQTKPFWKKKPFVKLSNKVRRARQNAKLKRVLNPKNALTFLNELKPGNVKFNVREETGWGFIASVDIDGKTYTGNGLSVSKAKVQASEQALKQILLEQMAKPQVTSTSADKDEVKEDEDVDMEPDSKEEKEGEEPKTKGHKTEIVEDELPWGSLAAFALHKLFEQWQEGDISGPPQVKYDEDIGEEPFYRRPGPPDYGYSRRLPPGPAMFGRGRARGYAPYPPMGGGYNAPRRIPPPPAINFLGSTPRVISLGNVPLNNTIQPMKKIPEDANKRNPVMLLNQLRPNVVYDETREGDSHGAVFKISIEINGQEYVGRGKSKKDAKKMAAKAALVQLGVVYEDDNQ